MRTYKLNFKLREPEAETETYIFLQVYYDNKRFIYYIGEKLKPMYWNSKEQRAILTNKELKEGKLPEYVASKNREINNTIGRYRTALENIMIQFSYQGIFPSTKTLKDEIDKVFNHQKEDNQPLYLVPFIEEIIRKTNHQFNTVRNYTTTKNHLKTFEDQRGKRIKISDIDLDFYDEFVRFFHDKGSSVNTLGTNIKNLKVFLGIASDRDILVNSDFRKKRFKVVEETADTIYLSPKEIEKLLKLDLSAVKKWERVRDLFVIECFTGLRFSDYNQVTIENIQKHDKRFLLKARITKTGQTVVIPLRNEVLQILKRYDNQLPKAISNQKMNEYLKSIGEKAKINELVNVTKSEGIFHKQTTVNKWKLISTHTARRSFATNAFLSGVDSLSLMKITGHTTEKSFHKYIKVSQQENALKLASHPYFIGQLQIAK